MWGVLQVRHLAGDWSHALCGPWGCGPALEAVLTCHLAWLVMLTPAVLYILRRLSPGAARFCGWTTIVVGAMGIAGVAAWEIVWWYPQAPEMLHRYLVQRILYQSVCLVDFPMIQLILSGAVILCQTGRRRAADGLAVPAHVSQTALVDGSNSLSL